MAVAETLPRLPRSFFNSLFSSWENRWTCPLKRLLGVPAVRNDTGRMPVLRRLRLRNIFPQRENTNDPQRKVQAKQVRCPHHNQWRHGQDAQATTNGDTGTMPVLRPPHNPSSCQSASRIQPRRPPDKLKYTLPPPANVKPQMKTF